MIYFLLKFALPLTTGLKCYSNIVDGHETGCSGSECPAKDCNDFYSCMISRTFHSSDGSADHPRYGCGMKTPEYNFGQDYCCIGPSGEKKCKTYYDDELSNVDTIYDKSGVETDLNCEPEQDTTTTTEVPTTTVKTTESGTTTEAITTQSQNTTDSVLPQSVFILGLLILINT